MAKGFVYILTNKALDGLLKIGFTSKVPEFRANELSGTGLPEPYRVSYYCLVGNAKEVERNVHIKLAGNRQSKNREFFRLDINSAVGCIKSVCSPEHEWSDEVLLRSQEGRVINIKELNYEVYGVSIYSRRGDENQINEMVSFCEALHEDSMSSYIKSLMYCSNSDCCFFECSPLLAEYSAEAKKIREIARRYIGQFEMHEIIDHGRPILGDGWSD